jgi:mRNA degradation ribonuclease J1/J2
LNNENRVPEAIVLTHPHLDHTLGIDWIAQSYYFTTDKKMRYPIYATKPCFEIVLQMYPHLKKILAFTELIPGVSAKIKEVSDVSVTAYPVFHGESGFGAAMLLFEC